MSCFLLKILLDQVALALTKRGLASDARSSPKCTRCGVFKLRFNFLTVPAFSTFPPASVPFAPPGAACACGVRAAMAEAARRRAEDSFLEDVQLDDSEVCFHLVGEAASPSNE